MNGARAILESLIAHGVDTVFGHPGGAVIPLYDAIYDSPIRHILVRHEQGGAHAAEGYARATGRVGVCIATSGPGATNLVTGLADAMMDSTPLVAITGNVPRALIGTDAFQEADITGITLPITKHNFLVRSADELSATIAEAFRIARSGRPGPVLVDVPKDVQLEKTSVAITEPYRLDEPMEPDADAVAEAVAMIAAAERPVLMVGGGAQNSSEAVMAFAQASGLPVITTLMGLGVFPASHQQHLGMPGMHGSVAANRAISNADLIVAAGMRFDDRVTGKTTRFAPKARVVHIDVDATEHSKLIRAHLAVRADATAALDAISAAIPAAPERREWWSHLDDWKGRQPRRHDWGAAAAVASISAAMQPEDIIVTDVGQHQMLCAQIHPVEGPRRFITSGGAGTMGYGLPAGMGAQLAEPESRVVVVAGDGGVQMNIQELATLRKYDIPVKLAIINNGYLGMVRQWQELFHQQRYSEVYLEDSNPDFVMLAAAYRIPAWRASNPQEMASAVRAWLDADGPALLDVSVPQEWNVYPMVPAGAALEDMLEDGPHAAEREKATA
ncbi:MAG TPA: biosynthetic-type acetolactate synthase large subunit [Deinococcales bacterium]|nr:biosynthetic-type acetolactate synthase large subunit [Deinococcales bacterium]